MQGQETSPRQILIAHRRWAHAIREISMVHDSDDCRILIVEDDPKTSALVQTYLRREGFAALVVADGNSAIRAVDGNAFAFVILDLMVPGPDGWEICRHIRKGSDVPILFLTARDEEVDRVAGLELGADDYVVKPFSPRELVARVKAILRRPRPHHGMSADTLRIDGLELIPEKRRVTLKGAPLAVTRSEFTLLRTLMSRPGWVFSRRELLTRLYPDGEAVVDRVVDVHIGKLRRKIEPDVTRPHYIRTVRGIGYQFVDEVREYAT
jgi:DNA-binding response OmpR family regulator